MHNFDFGTHYNNHGADDYSLKPHHNHHGETIGYSQKNVFGGKNYFNENHEFTGYTAHNHIGGNDYHNSDGVYLGHTSNFNSDTHPFTHADSHSGSTPQMIKFHDPAHIHDHFNGIRSNLLNDII